MKEEETYEFYREQTLLLADENKELKERIDKAIEYIEKEKLKDEEDNFIDLYLDKYESDSSLYHLAGDSIVCNILCHLFKELL